MAISFGRSCRLALNGSPRRHAAAAPVLLDGPSRYAPILALLAIGCGDPEASDGSASGGGGATLTSSIASGGTGGIGPGASGQGSAGAGGAPPVSDICTGMGDVGSQADFDCTEIIGFSQTGNWWGGTDPYFESSPSIDEGRWQIRWHGGAGIENWPDPGYEGWDRTAPATNFLSACSQGSTSPERVILTISSNVYDSASTPEEWAAGIEAAVGQVRAQLPSVTKVILQPVVGAAAGLTCDTRASDNHPVIVEAIGLVVGADVVRGATPVVMTCEHYQDQKGHLTPDGSAAIGSALGQCYGSSP